MKGKDRPSFDTEAELCAAFIADVREQRGWIVYPETAGFDVLLVREDTGHQLGIEAKLSLNAKVIEQILPNAGSAFGNYDYPGPDWRAVLVPSLTDASAGLAQLLGIVGVMTFIPRRGYRREGQFGYRECWQFSVCEPASYDLQWFDFNPPKRCELPEFVPSVAAGVPAPVQLTPWKIGALRVLADLELDGFTTAKGVRAHGIDARRFCASDGWLTAAGDGRWTRGTLPRFEEQHPSEYSKILEEARAKRQEKSA